MDSRAQLYCHFQYGPNASGSDLFQSPLQLTMSNLSLPLIQRLHVRQILQSPRRQFIRAEIRHADYRQINFIDPLNDAFGVTVRETHAVYRGQQIDACRCIAELHHGIRCREICGRYAKFAKAEFPQCVQHEGNILVGSVEPNINIAGIAGMTMRRQRIAADNQVLNVS